MKKFKDTTVEKIAKRILAEHAEAAIHFNNIYIKTKVALRKLQARCRHSRRQKHDWDTSPWTQCLTCGKNLSERKQ